MRRRDVGHAALGPLSPGVKDWNAFLADAIRARIGQARDVDPRVFALELGKEPVPVFDRKTLGPGVRAELRGRRILYRWTPEDWALNLWIGIDLAVKRARPGLRACRPLLKFAATP
jgi:hypothetical protein